MGPAQASGLLGDIRAAVAVFREGLRYPQQLGIARPQRAAELLDLPALIVEVELRGHAVALRPQEPREDIADRGLPSVGHAQRPGGILADELDVDGARRRWTARAESASLPQDVLQHP